MIMQHTFSPAWRNKTTSWRSAYTFVGLYVLALWDLTELWRRVCTLPVEYQEYEVGSCIHRLHKSMIPVYTFSADM